MVYLVEGAYIAAESFREEGMKVPFYGKIRWQDQKQPSKNAPKYVRRLPPPLRCLLGLIDGLKTAKELAGYRVAVLAACKLESEREELSFKDPSRVSPSDGFVFTHNGANFAIAGYLGLSFYRGIGLDHVCSSGIDLLGMAYGMISRKEVDAAVVATVNSMADSVRVVYHKNLGVLSKSGVIRPFDERRDGTVFADSAAVAVVASERVVEDVGVTPLARIEGYSFVADTYHMFSIRESGEGFERVATEAAGGKTPRVIKAHATGTRVNDAAEARAYSRVFGREPVVTALKPIFGHSVTSCGLTESLHLLEALREGRIPKIENLERPDASCEGITLALEELPFSGGYVLSVAAGFGGFYSAILFCVEG